MTRGNELDPRSRFTIFSVSPRHRVSVSWSYRVPASVCSAAWMRAAVSGVNVVINV